MKAPAMRNRIRGLLLCLVLAPVIAGAQEPVGTANPLSDALVPAPALSPGEVVRIQLEALRHNDRQNHVASRSHFASRRRPIEPIPDRSSASSP